MVSNVNKCICKLTISGMLIESSLSLNEVSVVVVATDKDQAYEIASKYCRKVFDEFTFELEEMYGYEKEDYIEMYPCKMRNGIYTL